MESTNKFKDFPSAYTSFEEIPESNKLYNYNEQFQNKDVWQTYVSDRYSLDEISETTIQALERVGTRWREVCDKKCHHACASPSIINDWCIIMLERMTEYSAKNNYLTYINLFYRYLMWNIDYPHSYNPVQFAVIKYPTVNSIWSTDSGRSNND